MTILIILFFVEYAKTHARIERELIELNDNKSKFFSIISHDLRNPVKNIVLMAQLLTEEANSKTYDPLKIASMIQGSANNLSSLLDNLLKWSRLQMNRIEVNTETLNLKKIVADVIRHQNIHASQKSIFISNHIPEEYYVLVDQNMFTTVLRNLLSNAIKFTEKGGQIDLSANQTGNYIELLVADTGVGIPDEVAEKIFSLDFKLSTKGTNKEEGTGLGLKLAKEFIEKNKGSIRLESALKKGTKFYVSIPSA
jgi:signal transduction histidine kinase